MSRVERKHLQPLFQKIRNWVEKQEGNRRPTDDDRDKARRIRDAILAVLSHDGRRYRRWFDRSGCVSMMRRPEATMFLRKWHRKWLHLLDLVESELSARDDDIDSFFGIYLWDFERRKDLRSITSARNLAKARERRQRVREERRYLATNGELQEIVKQYRESRRETVVK